MVTPIIDVVVLVVTLLVAHVSAISSDLFADVRAATSPLVAQPADLDLAGGGASIQVDEVAIITGFDGDFSAISTGSCADV